MICSICLEPMYTVSHASAGVSSIEFASNVSALECGHSFHSECIGEWIDHASGIPTCPQCRQISSTHAARLHIDNIDIESKNPSQPNTVLERDQTEPSNNKTASSDSTSSSRNTAPPRNPTSRHTAPSPGREIDALNSVQQRHNSHSHADCTNAENNHQMFSDGWYICYVHDEHR